MDPEVLQTYLQEFANQMRNSFAEQLESNKISILEQLDAKFEKFYHQNKNPIQLGKVDEGNFNFPISSLPKGEGVFLMLLLFLRLSPIRLLFLLLLKPSNQRI